MPFYYMQPHATVKRALNQILLKFAGLCIVVISMVQANTIADTIYDNSNVALSPEEKSQRNKGSDSIKNFDSRDTVSIIRMKQSQNGPAFSTGNSSYEPDQPHYHIYHPVEFSIGTGLEYLSMVGLTLFPTYNVYMQLQGALGVAGLEAAALGGVQWGGRFAPTFVGRVGIGYSCGRELFSTACHGVIIQAGFLHYATRNFAVSVTAQVQQRIFAKAPPPPVEDGGGPELLIYAPPNDIVPSVNICLVIGL